MSKAPAVKKPQLQKTVVAQRSAGVWISNREPSLLEKGADKALVELPWIK